MIGLFTNIFLEITTTAIWWMIKKTGKGIYYLVWGSSDGKTHYKPISTKTQYHHTKELEKIQDDVIKYEEKNKELENEIKKLEQKIEIMENYINSISTISKNNHSD
jgi:hypothetical protein